MIKKTIRIATRKSPLALWQANHVRELLTTQWPDIRIDLLPLVTSGDKFLKDKLLEIGGKGLFVKELEEALLDQRADIAVHSTKDVPAVFPDGLSLPVICKRDNPLDALVSEHFSSLDELPQQAIVGTSSLRRQSQILAYRPDLCIKPLRGNIHTRLEKLKSGEYQAIVLAASGLERMGLGHLITQHLSDTIMLPACGQGALSIECRTDDLETKNLIAGLNDSTSSLCVGIERQVNARLGGNCHVPIAIYCSVTPSVELHLRAKIGTLDGSSFIHDNRTGKIDQAHQLAEQCSQSLLDQGAAELLDSIPK